MKKSKTVDEAYSLIKSKYNQFQFELDKVRRQKNKLGSSGKTLLKKLERVEREVEQDLEELRYL